MTSSDIVDVGFMHLNTGPEAETAEWAASQLSDIKKYTVQLYPYSMETSWGDMTYLLDTVRAGVRFTAIMLSHQTPELMHLAISMILQGNSDWILPIRCEDCPQSPALVNLPYFDILGVSGGVGEPALTSMVQHMQAVLSPLQDLPDPDSYHEPHYRQW